MFGATETKKEGFFAKLSAQMKASQEAKKETADYESNLVKSSACTGVIADFVRLQFDRGGSVYNQMGNGNRDFYVNVTRDGIKVVWSNYSSQSIREMAGMKFTYAFSDIYRFMRYSDPQAYTMLNSGAGRSALNGIIYDTLEQQLMHLSFSGGRINMRKGWY